MTEPFRALYRAATGSRVRALFTSMLVLVVAFSLAIPAIAVVPAGLATLEPSTFEIDDNANLKVDNAGYTDWAGLVDPNGPELRATDALTGQNDDSYSGGTKEDTSCPSETTGSIPNNKSDLLTFHVYEEPGVGGHPGFLNLAWSRVSDPSGTTLMDFEFNQSETNCPSGPNKVRTAGDLLIEYAIDQGGARANITGRTWTGTAWGPALDLDTPSATCGGNPCAVGTISSTAIAADDSDGLGAKQARTFGEAQIDLRLIFQAGSCRSFGSAMLKSRSSDSFTSQLKDFIRPVGISLTNCGTVIIRKATDPSTSPNFGFTKSFGTDPATGNTFELAGGGSKTYTNVLFGTGYTVVENALPSGWDFVSIDCSASSNVTPSINAQTRTVTFAIDSADDVLDCTYNNRARGTIVVEKITSDGQGAFDFTSGTLTPSPFTLTTTGAGAAGKAIRTFSDLAPGTYDVAETVPAGWNLTSATCSDGSNPATIGLSGGETVTCTFTNARERGAILIVKTRKHAAATGGEGPHAGVTFTVTGGELAAAGVSGQTNAAGELCIDNLVVSSLVGNYSVTETVPAGYRVISTNPQGGIVVTESTCASGATRVEFENMPLTNVTVSVDSVIDGGTASTIDCDWAAPNDSAATGPNGDGSLTRNGLEPGTYTCTIVIDP